MSKCLAVPWIFFGPLVSNCDHGLYSMEKKRNVGSGLAFNIVIVIVSMYTVEQSTVLCKSNASEMQKFCSLFKRTFQESSRESSSDNSRPFERNFPRTKNAFPSTFPYKTKFHNQKHRFTNSVPEISRWTDTTIPCTIYSIYPSYNVRESYTGGFQCIPELEFSHEQKEEKYK